MPPTKNATTPPPVKVKAGGKTKAAPPKANKPVIIPHRPATAPAEKLVPRRGWKGPPLPFNDMDSALAWGFGNMKVADAEDEADAFKASDAHHRARTKAAEDELRTLPKRDAAGVLRSRAERHAQDRAGPAVPGAPAAVARGVRDRAKSVPANARGRQSAAPEDPPPAAKTEPPAAKTKPPPAPAKEPPPAPAKEPPPAAKTEPPPETDLLKAIRVAEEALKKEHDFRKELEKLNKEQAPYQKKHRRMPAELKKQSQTYNPAALRKLTQARVAAEQSISQKKAAAAAAVRTPPKKR